MEKSENELERVGVCLTDIKDQRAIVRDDHWLVKEVLKQLKAEKRKIGSLWSRSGHTNPVASCSVSGQPLLKGAVAKQKCIQKRGKC